VREDGIIEDKRCKRTSL